MNNNTIIEVIALLIRKYAVLLLVQNKSADEAFNILKKELQQEGLSEKSAANTLRLAVGLYLGEEKYAKGAMQALAVEATNAI
jgi:hypothetical protein